VPPTTSAADPVFFATPAEFRDWLDANHESARELLVGFYKKGSGRPSITWPESVDEALCVGWIDGVRRSLGEEAYTIRFTPRKPRSNWSAVNIARMAELIREGRVRPAGLRAFEARAEERSGIYAYENRDQAALTPEMEAELRARPGAWEFFQAQPEWYRKTAVWRILTGKKPETRQKRLAELIEDSANGRWLKGYIRSSPRQP
jgi:uncharacterized protein YdeI (YjbR/CyaY-like superfamily)